MAKISVIMLTYNRENVVERAIQSILAQTVEDFEYLIIDNGSTDRSGEICDHYAQQDARIKVMHKEKGNIGSGRNCGLDAAQGEYIAFIDDDDYAEPDFLHFLYQLAIEHDADISICGAADKVFDEKHVYCAEEAVIELLWRRRFNVQFPTKLIKRTLFDHIRFSEQAKYDDIELMPRILAAAARIAYHGLPKYTFYRHENNHSAWTTNHQLLDAETLGEYLQVYQERTSWLCTRFPHHAPIWRYFNWSFMVSMVEKINRLTIENCEQWLQDMVDELRENQAEFLSSEFIKEFEREWMNIYIRA